MKISEALHAFTKDIEIQLNDVTKKHLQIEKDSKGHAIIVDPDKVKDQETIFQLLEKHAFEICKLIDTGSKVLIPIPKGTLLPKQAYSLTVDILGTNVFGVAIPSDNQVDNQAFSNEDLKNLFSGDLKPLSVHLFGMTSADEMFDQKKEIIQSLSPKTMISMDKNHILTETGKGRPDTKKQDRFQPYSKETIEDNLVRYTQNGRDRKGRHGHHENGVIELFDNEITREELKTIMENISSWDCKYSPESLTDIYLSNGPDSIRLADALGEEWYLSDEVYSVLQKTLSERMEDDTEEETLQDARILADADAYSSEFDSPIEDTSFMDWDEELDGLMR